MKHNDRLGYLSITLAFIIFYQSQKDADATDQKLDQILKELKELKECNSIIINNIEKLEISIHKNTHPNKENVILNIPSQNSQNKKINDIKRRNPHGKRTDKN